MQQHLGGIPIAKFCLPPKTFHSGERHTPLLTEQGFDLCFMLMRGNLVTVQGGHQTERVNNPQLHPEPNG
jgi:hypothetical protein